MPLTAEQLLERRRYLGASEAAAAVGRCPYFTPLELYKAKHGDGTPIEETIPMMVGTALEPVVLELLERQEGITVTDRQRAVVDDVLPWRRATLDGISSDGGIVQAKSSGQWGAWGKADDAIPEHIIHQVQHEMAVTNLPFAWVPVILSQREFRVYRIERDQEHIDLLTQAETEFWQRVLTNEEPAPISHEDLKILYPQDRGIQVRATLEIQTDAYELARVKAEIKLLEKAEDTLALRIKTFMGDAAELTDVLGNTLFTNKSHLRVDTDVKQLRKDLPDIAKRYERQAYVRSLLNKIK